VDERSGRALRGDACPGDGYERHFALTIPLSSTARPVWVFDGDCGCVLNEPSLIDLAEVTNTTVALPSSLGKAAKGRTLSNPGCSVSQNPGQISFPAFHEDWHFGR
jgi:hypothetical protein